MGRIAIMVCVCFVVMSIGGIALAVDKGVIGVISEGCKKELDSYCKDVTPGEGRVLACLYAYGDKLSNRCEYALYDAAAQLQRVIAALTYLANECRADLKAFCSDVKSGEGRLIQCIDRNKDKISDRCKQAIKDVGEK